VQCLVERIEEAVARLRLVQAQAWADHDADEARERLVLGLVARGQADRARYQSQWAQYLRVVLEAEKEIARLDGLCEALGPARGRARSCCGWRWSRRASKWWCATSR
jgi:hypothetical protein